MTKSKASFDSAVLRDFHVPLSGMRMASFTSRAFFKHGPYWDLEASTAFTTQSQNQRENLHGSTVRHSVEMLEAPVLLGPTSGKMRLLTRHTIYYPVH